LLLDHGPDASIVPALADPAPSGLGVAPDARIRYSGQSF
jgi:hypothetical protein